MDLRDMTYIVTIAQEGSISRAAERLYMAQSSLSQSLQRYEAELGTKLFMRTASGVRPTFCGELFIKRARHILQQYHQLKSELGDIAQLPGGRIEFGISTFRGTYLLPHVMQRFYRLYPDVEVIIHEEHSMRLQEMIAAGELDMALIIPQGEEMHGRCDPVMRDEVMIIAHEDHPVMRHTRENDDGQLFVEMRDAAQFPFFLSGRSTMLGGIAARLFSSCDAYPKALSSNMSAQLSAAMARQGLGLALTYRSCVEPSPHVRHLAIGQARFYLHLALIYPPDGYQSRATRALADLIRQYMAKP